MAPGYNIDTTLHIVRVDYGGVHPSFAQWKGAMETVFADPRFVAGYGFLFDKRGCRAATREYVEAAADFYRAHTTEFGPWAILVSDSISYGMGRMTEGYCGSDDGVRSFTDQAEAERWLTARVTA